MKNKTIDVSEKFKIFDNFINSNQHLIKRGDDEWDSSKIFFQLSASHAEDSPLSEGADKFKADGKLDWDYYKSSSRADKMYLSAVVRYIDLGVDNEVNYSIDLENSKTLYCFKDMNDMLIYDYKTDEKIFLSGHKNPPSKVIELNDMLISYDIEHDYTTTLIIWKNYIPVHKSTIYRALQDLVKFQNKIVMKFKDGTELIPISELNFLEKNWRD
ncbi:MAG: hypothetical protein U9P72_07630 [Campylobacterota bacterium]|nr:hypothetical protein [Campylobacterota bacterium]